MESQLNLGLGKELWPGIGSPSLENHENDTIFSFMGIKKKEK